MAALSKAIDRVFTFRNSQGQDARGELLHMSRSQIVFEVYNPYSVVQLSEVLVNIKIKRGGTPIYTGKAVVTNLVNTGLMLIVSAALVDPWSDVTALLGQSNDVRGEVDQFIADWEGSKRIRPGYQLAVGELRSFLTQLSPWLDQVDMASNDDVDRVPREVYEQLREGLMPKVAVIQQQFEHEAKLVAENEIEAHRMFAQRDLLPLMMRAPFFYRSYVKPLGYAGDYLMVKMMVEGKREGPTTYSRLVNDFYLEIDLVKGHRNRLLLLEEKLTQLARRAADENRTLSVLNIGCGPAIEIVRFIKNCADSERCSFRLVDFNAETLQYTTTAIEDAKKEVGRSPDIVFEQKSVNDLLKASSSVRRSPNRQYDLVYCAGLFDYFSDKVCARLLELFCDWTKIGGRVVATNVHPNNPTRLIMEHVVEWHLVHRTAEDFAKLSPRPHPYQVYDDASHTNVFLDIVVAE